MYQVNLNNKITIITNKRKIKWKHLYEYKLYEKFQYKIFNINSKLTWISKFLYPYIFSSNPNNGYEKVGWKEVFLIYSSLFSSFIRSLYLTIL